jgi:nucleoside-diphosphate-sugar epimerase
MTNKKTVLVTGASGFVALHLIQRLLAEGFRVRGTLRDAARGDEVRRHLGPEATGEALEFVAADLTRDEGWAEAVAGCDYVHHVASPYPDRPPRDEAELIAPARDGTLRIMRAAAAAPSVQRVVMTSSTVAVFYGEKLKPLYDESDWSDVSAPIGAYGKSKTLAERAARDFVSGLPAERGLEFVSINPGVVLGPLLGEATGTSTGIVRKAMRREIPGMPRVGFPYVDVRDVADAHFRAMTVPAAAGQRYICAAGSLWFRELGVILGRHLAGRGYRIPTRELPDWLVRAAALFEPSLRLILRELGRKLEVDTGKIRRELGWSPRPIEATITDTADSLIARGIA